jgi:hypothetical protein
MKLPSWSFLSIPASNVSVVDRLCGLAVRVPGYRSGFDSQDYHIFWEVVGLERGPLSLVSTTEELLWRKSSGSSLETWDYGRRDASRWPHGTLYPQKLALNSPTSGDLSDGVVRSRTQATEFFINVMDSHLGQNIDYRKWGYA